MASSNIPPPDSATPKSTPSPNKAESYIPDSRQLELLNELKAAAQRHLPPVERLPPLPHQELHNMLDEYLEFLRISQINKYVQGNKYVQKPE